MKKTVVFLLCSVMAAVSISPAFAAEPQPLSFNSVLPSGDLAGAIELNEVEEIDEETQNEIDRAMRAYTPPAESLLINNAESFFYYDQLDMDTQAVYDALMMAVSDPSNMNNFALALTPFEPGSEEFYTQFFNAYYSMLYDHPELFWLYNSCQTDLNMAAPDAMLGDYYIVYLSLSNPVPNYEEQQTAFNEAAEAFLADIDLTQSDAEIARAIHDKLVNTVTYDMAVLEGGMETYSSLAHTAYGALVQNEKGQANYAVCDGYSQAYMYLLQQTGIEATIVLGNAGSSDADLGGHAWNVIKLDDKWYEVDSTWDDAGTLESQITEDIDGYAYFVEALTDTDYRGKLEHYLYTVSTDTMTNFIPDVATYSYTTKDGLYAICLVSPGVHYRCTVEEFGPVASVIANTPIAD